MKRVCMAVVLMGATSGCSTTYQCDAYDVDEGYLYSTEYEASSSSEAEEICKEDGGGYSWLYCVCE